MKENIKVTSDSNKKSQPKSDGSAPTSNQESASGRWNALHRTRLPHKQGVPLSSSSCGDAIER